MAITLPGSCEVPGCAARPHSRWKGGAAMCMAHWQRMYKWGNVNGRPPKLPKILPTCEIEGCTNRCRSHSAKYCEKHYYRRRRGHEPSADPVFNGSSLTAAGYRQLHGGHHPMRTKFNLYEHRKVAYDKHGGECPACFWCALPLTWKVAVVDHLNEIKDDNQPENLVVACNPCNRARGAIKPFLKRLQEEKLTAFIETIRFMREN